jgi:hypothetical protein
VRTKGGKVGNQDELERNIDEREGAAEDVEAHGLQDAPSEGLQERSSEEADDVEGHMLGERPLED